MHHEPSTWLTDFQVPMKFHARNGFEERITEINTNRPLSHGNIGTAVLVTSGAWVWYWGNFLGLITATFGAGAINSIFKSFYRGFLGLEHIHHLNEWKAF